MTKSWSSEQDSGFIRIFALLFVCLSVMASARAQSLVHADEVRDLNRFFDQQVSARNSLPCHIYGSSQARLNFLFRYSTDFRIKCDMGKILPGDTLLAFIRIKPSQGEPVLLSEEFDVPKLSTGQFAPLQQAQIFLSGGFTLGEGSYSAEVILTDQKKHICRKAWKFKTFNQKQARSSPLALPPYAVAPLLDTQWDGKLASNGLRLTVLLHASPASPDQARLHAWDSAELLESLTSLLSQLPCKSVRIVAFSLGQQTEVFRQEQFDAKGFADLAKALGGLETVTVPVQALQHNAWTEMLTKLVQDETFAKGRSDAVVFLGPPSHFDGNLPGPLLEKVESTPLHFFYFEYSGLSQSNNPFSGRSGAIAPDGIARLTKHLHGKVFEIYSPDDLGRAIHDMLENMKSEQKRQPGGDSSARNGTPQPD